MFEALTGFETCNKCACHLPTCTSICAVVLRLQLVGAAVRSARTCNTHTTQHTTQHNTQTKHIENTKHTHTHTHTHIQNTTLRRACQPQRVTGMAGLWTCLSQTTCWARRIALESSTCSRGRNLAAACALAVARCVLSLRTCRSLPSPACRVAVAAPIEQRVGSPRKGAGRKGGGWRCLRCWRVVRAAVSPLGDAHCWQD